MRQQTPSARDRVTNGSPTRGNFVLYVTLLLLFGAGIIAILHVGSGLQPPGPIPGAQIGPASTAPPAGGAGRSEAPGGVTGALLENVRHPLSVLLLQVLVIIIASRAVGALLHRLGQPTVIGEMLAGILLGPSLLGMLSPATVSFLFPPSSMESLHLLSQIGVILFMFLVGIDLDTKHLRERAHAAVLVSHASIIVPFFLGTAFSLTIYRSVAPPGVTFTAFALFMGIAMSITAFPVLVRVLEEKGLTGTPLGSTAIACAAVDDVTAWCLLALVVAIVKAHALTGAALTVSLALAFTCLMLLVLAPRVGRAIRKAAATRPPDKELVAAVLAFVMASALLTEMIGIHALFGAFLAGVIMPSDGTLRPYLRGRLEAFSSAFLLPLFFAFTGLRTQIGLLGGWRSWLMCAGIITVAIAGKFGASALAARWTGMSWVESLSIGALMNTRGLMELIALNIGYDLGILSPRMFAMMVLMALTTTLMAGPVLSLLARFGGREESPSRETGGLTA
ncbi:MAG TPA: cation:proton antiporter [Candidatus Polarisedimenticolia bacterium]